MFGRLPTASRNRSHTASFTRRVVKSRLFSGLLIAVRLTRSVRSTEKYCCQGIARAAA